MRQPSRQDFAGIVPSSRGAHCRPLHPRLASLCSVKKPYFMLAGAAPLTKRG